MRTGEIEDAVPARFPSSVAPYVVLIAIVIGLYWPEWTFRKSFFYFDISSLSLPARDWGFRQVAAGYFPQWCRHWQAGFPFVAESQSGICYPPNYFFYPFLDGWKAYAVSHVFHVLLAALSSFLLFRRRCSAMASLVGALMFALGGRLLTHQVHTSFAEVIAWFPLVLLFLDRFAESGRIREIAAAALFAGMQVLAGALHAALCCHLGYFAFLAAHAALAPRNALRIASVFFCFVVLSAGLGAVLVFPAMEQLGESARVDNSDRQWAAWGAFPPQLWIVMYLPYVFGHLGHAIAWLEGPLPWQEMSFYHGLWAIPLAAAAWFGADRKGVWLSSVLVMTGLVLAAGDLHVITRACNTLPALDSIRVPARFLVVTGVGLCSLAALGCDSIIDATAGRIAARIAAWTGAGLLGISMLVAGWFYRELIVDIVVRAGGEKTHAIFESSAWRQFVDLLSAEIPWTIGFLTIGWLCILRARRAWHAAIALCALVAVDLGRHARLMYPTIEPSFHAEPASARFVKSHFDPPRVFVYQPPQTVALPGFHYTMQPYHDLGECLYWERGPLFDVSLVSVFGTLPLQPARWNSFHQRLIESDNPWYYQLMGVAAMMTGEGVQGGPFENPPAYRGEKCFIYRVHDASDYAYVCNKVRWAAPGAALDVLVSEPADPRTRLVLETAEPQHNVTAAAPVTSPARVVWRGPNAFVATFTAANDGYLLVNESWNRGWLASESGHALPILRANHLFMAVAVAAGPHEIAFSFSSRSVQWGAFWSCASLVVAVLLLIFGPSIAWQLPSNSVSNRVLFWLAVAFVASYATSAIIFHDDWSQVFEATGSVTRAATRSQIH